MLATSRKLVVLAQDNDKKLPPVLKSSSLQDDELMINQLCLALMIVSVIV